MFDESYTSLTIKDIAPIIDEINKSVEGSVFDALESSIMVIDIPFYPNYRFLDIADHATNPPLRRYAVQKKETMDFTFIDWTYKVIYELNDRVPIALTDKNVLEYVRFFFSFVKGRHGRFIICESMDSVQWKDDPPQDIRKVVQQSIHPMKIIEKRSDGVYKIETVMMLKDALFKTDIYVEPNGQVTMSDHEILMENIPVIDSVLGQ